MTKFELKIVERNDHFANRSYYELTEVETGEVLADGEDFEDCREHFDTFDQSKYTLLNKLDIFDMLTTDEAKEQCQIRPEDMQGWSWTEIVETVRRNADAMQEQGYITVEQKEELYEYAIELTDSMTF